MRASAFAVIIWSLSITIASADFVVPVPLGETCLGDLNSYRVFWRTNRQQSVATAEDWSGRDESSGATFENRGQIANRRVLFLHPAFKPAPGATWVEFPITLPDKRPIRLSFGIGMSPESTGKSDGVTFASGLTIAGQTQTLMREHYNKSEWKDYQFDLSPYAGKSLALQFRVEPGPANNTDFDWGLFSDAKLTVGDPSQCRTHLVQRMTTTGGLSRGGKGRY